jgi:predicted permease
VKPLAVSLGIVFAGLMAGYGLQRAARARAGTQNLDLSRPRRVLQIIALIVLNPVANVGAIWSFELNELRIAFMPLLGVLALVVGGAAGLLLARAQRFDRAQAGAYFSASTMSNIGSIGGLLVFLFLGEAGFALVPFYRLFEEFCYYAFAFPIAKSFSPGVTEAPGFRKRIVAIVADPFIIVAVSSMALGFVLNLLGVPRPGFFSTLNSIVIPLASTLLLISIGLALKFGRIRAYIRAALLVAATKFVVVPGIVIAVAAAVGLGRFDGGLPLQVVVILSSMPVGFIALIPPSLYKLDTDLANTAWIVTTALLLVVVPLQMIIVRMIG